MVPKLTDALRHVRQDLAGLLEPTALRDLCHSLGHRWRRRLLDPVATIHPLLLQILHRNTACARLPLLILQSLLRRFADAVRPDIDSVGLWRGHRTWFVDGTGVSMPDTPQLQRAFGQPTNQAPGCGFPVARILGLFHAGTGLLRAFLVAPLRSHEMSRVARLHPEMQPGDILVGDRAFATYAHLALLAREGLHGVFRLSPRRVVDFTPNRPPPPRWNTRKLTGKARSRWVCSLGPSDQVVQWYRPYQRPRWIGEQEHEALPLTLALRECRYEVVRRGFRAREVTLVTTLLDAGAYPIEALAELYRQRWRVETDLAHLKITLGMDHLHCGTEAGVMKELTAFALVYNLVRLVMLEAAREQGVRAERVSFADASRWLADSPIGAILPALIVNPQRVGRFEPRCKKRRAKNYPYMIHPRGELKRSLLQ